MCTFFLYSIELFEFKLPNKQTFDQNMYEENKLNEKGANPTPLSMIFTQEHVMIHR